MATTYSLPGYTVYVDTSVAYSKKPSEPISTKLLKFVEKARGHTTIDVRVPNIVFEELTYQQFVIAQAAAENLRKNFRTLLEVCGTEGSQIPDAIALETGARKLMSKVAAEASLTNLPSPIQDINWAAVIHDSCWRHSPFEKPKSEDDLAEKGFRDRMVLETITLDAAKVEHGVIAFVSGDNLLRTAFVEQAKTKCPIEVYHGFDELVGHLDLLAKTKSSEFTNDVLSKVKAVFYDPNDPKCVVLSQGVLEHLTEEYSDEMSRPSLFSIGLPKYPATLSQSPTFPGFTPASMSSKTWFEDYSRWTAVTPLKLFASPPVFQSSKDDGKYHWISTITLARLLRRTEPGPGQSYGMPEERIRTKDVDVAWSCQIDPRNAQFSALSVERYTPTLRDSFVAANWHTRSAYDFPMFPEVESEIPS